MNYRVEKVSEDVETKQRVLILRSTEGEDTLALNVLEKEAVVLGSLLSEDGLPGRNVLDHLKNTASRGAGVVLGIKLLLIDSRDGPALTPVLIMRKTASDVEQSVPASLAHAAAWSVALNLPFEIDDGLVSALRSSVTVIPGEPPSGFRDFLAGLDEIDRV